MMMLTLPTAGVTFDVPFDGEGAQRSALMESYTPMKTVHVGD